MILVDTSIWIGLLSNRLTIADRLDTLLERREVAGHDLIYGDLLIGDPGGRTSFLTGYGKIHQARTLAHPEVVAFVRDRRLHGRGAGWIDIHLLASAIVDGMRLWTAAPRLFALAKELGAEWE